MTKSDVVSKIQKLLRLSKSDNPNEAALAASMAQELMLKFAVEEHELEGSNVADKEPIEVEGLGMTTRKIPRWQSALAHILSQHFFCKTYTTTGVDIYVVGRRTDREVFKATFYYLRDSIVRMCEDTWARQPHTLATHGKTWKSSFSNGAVDTVWKRLEANLAKLLNEAPEGAVNPEGAQTTAPAPSTAIVLAERIKDVEAFMKDNIPGLRDLNTRRRVSRDAFEKGKIAGHTLNLDPRATKSLK